MEERPPATDLRGGKAASEDSFTKSMTSFVEEYAVDIHWLVLLALIGLILLALIGLALLALIGFGLTVSFESFES